MSPEEEHQFLTTVMQGNDEAVRFCELLGQISQGWDDLVDADKDVDPTQVMWGTLISLAEDPFYRRHFSDIFPLIRSAALDWITANQLERGSDNDKVLSFVLRDSLVAVVHNVAYIVGGMAWAIEHGPAIRKFFHDETLSEYIMEHR